MTEVPLDAATLDMGLQNLDPVIPPVPPGPYPVLDDKTYEHDNHFDFPL